MAVEENCFCGLEKTLPGLYTGMCIMATMVFVKPVYL